MEELVIAVAVNVKYEDGAPLVGIWRIEQQPDGIPFTEYNVRGQHITIYAFWMDGHIPRGDVKVKIDAAVIDYVRTQIEKHGRQ